MSTNIEDDLIEATATKLTQADFDRAYKLDAGIKKLAVELEELKNRIKAEAKLGTKVHGNVVVKVTERNDKDVDALTVKFPFDGYADFYKQVLDPKKVPAGDLIFKEAVKVVSITFADAD